jgi:acyl-coenzyme A thioesterase PaaI-like protein
MTEHPFVTAMNAGDLEGATAVAREIPLNDLMGLRVAQHGPAGTVATMELNEIVQRTSVGTVHGGMLATLADVTSAWSLSGSYESAEVTPRHDGHAHSLLQTASVRAGFCDRDGCVQRQSPAQRRVLDNRRGEAPTCPHDGYLHDGSTRHLRAPDRRLTHPVSQNAAGSV